MTMAEAATPSRRRRRAGGGRGTASTASSSSSSSLSSRTRFDVDGEEGFISTAGKDTAATSSSSSRTNGKSKSKGTKSSKTKGSATMTPSSSTSLKSTSSSANSKAAAAASSAAPKAPSRSSSRKDRPVSNVCADAKTIENALREANESAGKLIASASLLKIISRASAVASDSMFGGSNGDSNNDQPHAQVIEGIILLEEKVGDVLSVVKKCLRVATSGSASSSSSSKTPKKPSSSATTKADGNSEKSQPIGQDDKVTHLRLAVHCLRAVCPLIASAVTSSGGNAVGKREGQMIENTIRLLYHAIVASEDVFTGAPSSSSSSSLVVRMDAANLCLSSCAVLSNLMNSLGMVCRGFVDKGYTDVDNFQPPSPLLLVLMNVPTDRLGEVGPMTAVQLAKIGAQSLLSSCTVLASLFLDGAVESSAMRSERGGSSSSDHQRLADQFGFSLVDANIMGQSTETFREMPISSFQLLIRSVASPWLNVFVKDASKEGIDGALSYSKRYQRLLWDTAARLEKKVSKMSSQSKKKEGNGGDTDTQRRLHFGRLVLCLRGDSILASLAMPGGVDASHRELQVDITSSADLRAAILEDRLSHACECAWKSATTYAQSVLAASSLDPTWYGGLGRPDDANRANAFALAQFHQRAGRTIDAFVQARLSCRSKKCDPKALSPPFSYIEYCANRAVHVGPKHQRVATKMLEDHDDKENSADGSAARIGKDHLERSSCDHDDGCIFSGLPFSFVHDPGLATLLDSEKMSKEVDGFLCGSAALSVVFATLQAVYSVYAPQSTRETPLQFDGKIVSVFNTLFLSQSDGRRLKLSLMNQCQKILAPLKLSSRVVHISKFVNSRCGGSKRSVDQVTISGANLLQGVIGECYAPLLSLIASAEGKSSSAEPSSSKASRLEMAQDCYIRAAMLADHLDAWASTQPSGSSDFKTSADQAIRRAYKLAMGSSDENAIMVAKSIGAIGKQRIERQNMASAIVPILLSAEIFASMFEKFRSSSYKLPIRFQQLSSLFESAGMPNEAMVSLAFAIHYKLRESTKTSDDHNEAVELNVGKTILRCVEVIRGGEGPFTVQSSSDGRPESSKIASCQYFSRFIRLYVKVYRKSRCEEKSLAVVPCATLIDITKRSRIGKTLEKALSLESSDESSQSVLPVYRVFQLLITRSGVGGLDAIAQVTFLNRALFMFGRVLAGEVANIQNDSNDDSVREDAHDEVKEWITKQLSSEFTGFLKLALTCASIGRGNAICEQQYRQYESSIYLSASASFFINHIDSAALEKGDDDLPNLRRSAIKYAEKAKLLLQKASDENGGRNDYDKLLLCAQQLAVDYYVMEVSRSTRSDPSLEASFYKDCIEAMEDIVGRLYNLEGRQNIADVASFFSFALARMNSELQLLGISTLAIRAAALITCLQDSACSEKPISDSSDQALALSNLISSLSEGGFHGACRSLLQGFLSRNYSCGRVDDFGCTVTAALNVIFAKEDISTNEIDLLATALLVHVQSSAPEHLGSSCQFLNDIIEVVRDQEDCEDASSWVHVRWILSTCQIGIAQQMEKVGDVPRSLDAYKDCSRSCRSALAFLRSPAGQSAAANIDPNTVLHPHNITHHFSVRLSQCLRDASSLYCRQGNYSKGEGYALSLVETMNALPDSTTKTSKRGASDLMSLLEASSEDDSVRRADALQFFVEIQAYSRDAAMVSSELQDRGRNPASFVDDNNVPEKALQNVRSTMRYGDIVARGIESGGAPAFLSYHDQSYATLLQLSSQDFFDEGCIPIIDDSPDNDLEVEQFQHLMSETRLRQANRLEVDIVGAPTENGDESNASSPSSLYRIVSESGYTSGLSRARSYYHIGLEFLSDARRNGELNQLWDGSSQFLGGEVPTCDTANEGPIPTAPFSNISSARESFTKAAALAGPASTLLSRQVMRCLALVTGPDNGNITDIGYTATSLVHSSVGSTQRQKVSQAFTRRTASECNDSRLGLLFRAMDTALHDRSLRNAAIQSMYDQACSVLPADWRFVAFASCPTGELLISVIYFCTDNSGQRGVASGSICIFPPNEQCGKGDLPSTPITPSIYEGILKPFDDIMERSRSQLKDMDSSSLDRYSETEKKRMWWEEREAIDKQLQEVIQEVEGKYFSSDALQTLVLGSSKNSKSDSDPTSGDYVASMCQGFEDSDNEEELECSLGNLADKFEAACAVMDDDVLGDSELEDEDETLGSKLAPEKMTVVQIKEELQSLGIDQSEFKQMRKAALVDLLQEKRQQHVRNKPGKIRTKRMSATTSPRRRSMAEAKTPSISSYQGPNGGAASTCTFLVLDEDLQRFPFESFNFMEARSICRVPSISFAIATLIERGQRRIRADNTKYVLDPEANLSSTKRTMLSALDSLTSKFKWTWEGVAGKIPSVDFMEAALTSHSGLFLYCGHGGGEKCFSRKQVEGLLMSSERIGTGRSSASSGAGDYDDSSDDEYEHSPRRCSSAILLMGCSSGRLVSINSSRTSPPKNLSLEYEPEGMALSYLCAGAPCVVGNLWDVTDRDIDRFCLALLEDFLDPRGDVPKSLPQCVAQARSVCKMRHIVGAAPVVYGVPVEAEKVS